MTVTAQQLEKALTVLDQVVAAVNIGRGSFTATYGHRTSSGSQEHAPLPVDVDLIDRKIAAHRFLMDRALKIAMETDQPLTGRDVHSLSNYLYARAPWIVAQLWGLDFYKAVVEHTNGLDNARVRREPKVFAGRCAECDTDLYAIKGQPEARCGTCGTTYEVLAWRDFAKGVFGQHIGTPADLSTKDRHMETIRAALAAADAVMFSDEAIERAARELARHRWQDAINVWDALGQDAKDRFRDQARIVVAALKSDA